MRSRTTIIFLAPSVAISIALAVGMDSELPTSRSAQTVATPRPTIQYSPQFQPLVLPEVLSERMIDQPVLPGGATLEAIQIAATALPGDGTLSQSVLDQILESDSRSPGPRRTPINSVTLPEQVSRDPGKDELAALRELAGSSTPSGRITGLRDYGSANESQSLKAKTPTPAPEPTPTQDPSLARVGGQFRGYTLLALMHPAARAMTEGRIATLLQSELSDLYLGVLVDGTFGINLEYLAQVVQRLTVDDRRLLLTLYLSNGPTMRRYDTTPIEAGFNLINPTWFREMIQTDVDIRNSFTALVQTLRPIVELNAQRSGPHSTIAVVMLEDNLQRDSFAAMQALTNSILGESVDYMRNPCGGCFPGNDEDRMGFGLELHEPLRLSELAAGDGLSLDGIGFAYPDEVPQERLSFEEIGGVIDRANIQQLRFFALWRAEWQGLGFQSIHPDERIYQSPTPSQIEGDIELLRRGLERVAGE